MGKKLYLILFIVLTLPFEAVSNNYTDPLLQFIYSTPYIQPKPIEVVEEEDTHQDDYDAEAEVYHWDNIYLCNLCDVEVIVDPYNDLEDATYIRDE